MDLRILTALIEAKYFGCHTGQQDADEALRGIINLLTKYSQNPNQHLLQINRSLRCRTKNCPSRVSHSTNTDSDALAIGLSGHRRLNIRNSEDLLEQCLEQGILEERECEGCRHRNSTVNEESIVSFPNILTLRINRYKWIRQHSQRTKLTNSCKVPLKLTFHPTVRTDETYELSTFIVHQGNSPEVGHYISYVRENNRWYLCDDSRKEEQKEEDIEKAIESRIATPYISIYSRVTQQTDARAENNSLEEFKRNEDADEDEDSEHCSKKLANGRRALRNQSKKNWNRKKNRNGGGKNMGVQDNGEDEVVQMVDTEEKEEGIKEKNMGVEENVDDVM